MNRLILFVLTFSFTSVAFASQVAIFNLSEKHDMEINYRLCGSETDGSNKACNDGNLIVKAKKVGADKNYFVMTPPKAFTHPVVWLEVFSAVEKDETGKAIAEGIFADNTNPGTCQGDLNNQRNSAILLNDMHQSPLILCNWSDYRNEIH